MAKLVKRTAVKSPKLLPRQESEDSHSTTPCKGNDENQNPSPTKFEPLLGRCMNCTRSAANSWTDRLCYRCHKEEAGFIFDDETKTWIMPKKGNKLKSHLR